MAHTLTSAPLANTVGLAPRYFRERQAADALAATQVPAAPAVTAPEAAGRCLDVVTADLRRRIATVGEPRRSVLALTAPAFAGVSLVLGLLFSH